MSPQTSLTAIAVVGMTLMLGCGRFVKAAGDGADDTESTETEGGADLPPDLAPDIGQDLPPEPYPDIPAPEGACPRIDFLFVVDNSASMAKHQTNLIFNFPDFVDGIRWALGYVNDYHVGVITTDTNHPWNVPTCEEGLSALVVNTKTKECGPYHDGANYMTQDDDLEDTFSCAARVGVDGWGFERPMAALVETVEGELADPGECNFGYLRDDSLLVIVVLTDEADGEYPVRDPEADECGECTSPGGPDDWFDAVVAARGGDESRIVVVSIIHYEGGPCPPEDPAFDGVNINEFTAMFTHGFSGGICEEDFGPTFDEAIGVIRTACEEYGG